MPVHVVGCIAWGALSRLRGHDQTDIRTADNHRTSPPPPLPDPLAPTDPPPPKTKVTLAGKNEISRRENLVGPFFGTQTFGSQTPLPLSSNVSLGMTYTGAGLHRGVSPVQSVRFCWGRLFMPIP